MDLPPEITPEIAAIIKQQVFAYLDVMPPYSIQARELQVISQVLEEHQLWDEITQRLDIVTSVEDGMTSANLGEGGPLAFVITTLINSQGQLSAAVADDIDQDNRDRETAKQYIDDLLSGKEVDFLQQTDDVQIVLRDVAPIMEDIIVEELGNRAHLQQLAHERAVQGKRPN